MNVIQRHQQTCGVERLHGMGDDIAGRFLEKRLSAPLAGSGGGIDNDLGIRAPRNRAVG